MLKKLVSIEMLGQHFEVVLSFFFLCKNSSVWGVCHVAVICVTVLQEDRVSSHFVWSTWFSPFTFLGPKISSLSV